MMWDIVLWSCATTAFVLGIAEIAEPHKAIMVIVFVTAIYIGGKLK